jgi:serine/threonine-protein kinase
LVEAIESIALERVGNVLNDKWSLERLLGVGGMAAVYAGCHRNGARAAIKVLHPHVSRHKEVRERFLREGYAANKVGHPGVVKVLDDDVVSGGPDEGTAYLVMELLEGESLQDRLERGQPLDEGEFLELARDVLDVLQVAHERGVVHRDLKPENLFLARDAVSGAAHVKVLDFGLARLLFGQEMTTHGLALGTPSFMSPEQAAGRVAEIDGRTDLFALAATGFRLRTDRRIHEADDPIELVRKMAQVAAPPIRSVSPDVSAPYARVIDRALEFRREDRYESAAAMREDVERALRELPAGAPEGKPSSRKPPLPPPRRPAATEPATDAGVITMDLSDSNVEWSEPFGVNESVRIPKHGSLWPWPALLIFGAVGVMLLRDDTRRTALFASLTSLRTWSTQVFTSARSNVSHEAPPVAPVASGVGPADAGVARNASGSIPRPATSPSGTASHGVTPARIGPAVRQPARSRGAHLSGGRY